MLRRLLRPVVTLTAAIALSLSGAGLYAVNALAPPPSSAALGMFLNEGGPNANLPAITSFANSSGINISYAQDFVDGSTWASIEQGVAGTASFYSTYHPTYQLVMPVNVSPGAAAGSTDFAGGAAGAYNSHFTTIAQNLVNNGEANAIVRLAWEFNGNWFPWSVNNNAADFVGYWRQIVNTMRAVPGQSFRFMWNPTLGNPSGQESTPYYPGDAWTDIIATDIYANQPFSTQTSEQDGLDWLAALAAQHGKQLAFGEWGLWNHSSDPGWWTSTGNWGVQHNAIMMIWSDGGNGVDITQQFPNDVAAIKALGVGGAPPPPPPSSTTSTTQAPGVITVQTTACPVGTVGKPYVCQLRATSTAGAVSWNTTVPMATPFPGGSWSGNLDITGTATAPSSTLLSFVVRDPAGDSVNVPIRLTFVSPPPPSTTTTTTTVPPSTTTTTTTTTLPPSRPPLHCSLTVAGDGSVTGTCS